MIDFLIAHGYVGMFIASFLAGSVLPFSSEVVMVALLAAGSPGGEVMLWGTLGNVLGSMLNFYIGSLGREEWITRWARVSPEQLERGKGYVRRYGTWAGLLAWIPLLGSLITVSLGYLRAGFWRCLFFISVGKFLRYYALLRIYQLGVGA